MKDAKTRVVERFGIYKRPPGNGEVNSGEQVTDPGGYIDQNRRVLQFIAAGEKLKLARREQYDIPEGQEPDFSTMDPTRRTDYDHTDAYIDAAIVTDRLAKQKQKAEDDKGLADDDDGNSVPEKEPSGTDENAGKA